MTSLRRQSGFTAVELLITLFVAAAFLIASYQLFNLIIKDGGATRAESRASNIAYDYLRQYSASATTIPCTASTPLNNAPITVDGLVSVKVTVTVSCLPNAINSLSKVQTDVTYNNPAQTVSYATYTSLAGSSGGTDITNGLVAWWKLNGDANTSVGSPNGVITNAISTTGQTGAANTAYAFNGSTTYINTASTFGLGSANVTISCWVYNPTATNSGAFVMVGGGTGYGIGMGGTSFENTAAGTKLIMLYANVRWMPTTTDVGTGWHQAVMTIDASGVPRAYLDGSLVAGTYSGTNAIAPGNNLSIIGKRDASSNIFNGSIDDVRLYNRALSATEIGSLYSAGAK